MNSPDLEKYELLGEIGHGGMATVYRARDKRLGREVAVKLIHRHLRQSPEILRRFIQEATTIAKLKHPNVVEVYDVAEEQSPDSYLVVELVEGCTLRDLLGRGPLLPEVAAAIVVEVGEGLAHAHAHGVVHRDVKPENVLIALPAEAGDPEQAVAVKLTDFGIAKLLDAQGLTSTGQVLGSPSHMAPEQIDGGAVDERADIFSLGVLLYECFVGKLPFAGQHPAHVLRKVLKGEYVAADRAAPTVGRSYSQIVDRAMARDPANRYATIREMTDALRAQLQFLQFADPQPLLRTVAVPDDQLEGQIVERLIAKGIEAQAGGNMATATSAFGRALAYRPADRQVMRRLSRATRRRLAAEIARWVGLGVAIAAVVAAGLWAWGNREGEPMALTSESSASPGSGVRVGSAPPAASASEIDGERSDAAVERSADDAPDPAALVARSTRGASSPKDLSSGVRPRPSAPPRRADPAPGRGQTGPRGGPKPRTRVKPSAPKGAGRSKVEARGGEPSSDAAVRRVVVRIVGATGGTVRIDGEPKPWFGDVQHTLSLGPHRFEFISPDPACCRSGQKVVDIVAGPGVQRVLGQIPFNEATLRIRSSDGSLGRAECPTLFSGTQTFPAERRVPMSRLQVTGVCTLRNEMPGALPERRVVRLRAGGVTVISWP